MLLIQCTNYEFPFDASEFFDYDVVFAAEPTPTQPSIIKIKPNPLTTVGDIMTLWPYLVAAGFNPQIIIED